MNALIEIQQLGYEVWAEGDALRLRWKGEGQPPAEKVRPLLEELKARKAEALEWLAEKADSCPSCGERLIVKETDTYRAVECPVRPVHYFRVEGKPNLAGFFSEPARDGNSQSEREVQERALELVRPVVDWLGRISPHIEGMRSYLDMPHADGFGQAERKRLAEFEDQLDRLSLAVARGEATKLEFDRAFKEYQKHWQKIRRLFVKTFKLDPGCGNCGFPHREGWKHCLIV